MNSTNAHSPAGVSPMALTLSGMALATGVVGVMFLAKYRRLAPRRSLKSVPLGVSLLIEIVEPVRCGQFAS